MEGWKNRKEGGESLLLVVNLGGATGKGREGGRATARYEPVTAQCLTQLMMRCRVFEKRPLNYRIGASTRGWAIYGVLLK